jgi:hypothetical protein
LTRLFCLTAGVKLLPRRAEQWGGLVINAELALGKNALRFLTGLREGYDRIPADCNAAAVLSHGEHERFGRGADARPEAEKGIVSIEALSVFGAGMVAMVRSAKRIAKSLALISDRAAVAHSGLAYRTPLRTFKRHQSITV